MMSPISSTLDPDGALREWVRAIGRWREAQLTAKRAGKTDATAFPSLGEYTTHMKAVDAALDRGDWARVHAAVRAIDPTLAGKEPATVDEIKALLGAVERKARASRVTTPHGLSAADVAVQLGCSYDSALRFMRRAGAVKVGNLVRIDSDRLNAYLEDQRCRAQGKQHTSSSIEAPSTRTSIASNAASHSTRRMRGKRSPSSPSLSRYSSADLRQDLRGKKH